jgi:uncharacterized protein YqjF (DUF2071 family)
MIDAVARQSQIATDAAHRPWPLRDTHWSQAETRRDVLFAHWRASLGELSRLLPPGLAADVFDGNPWLGLTAYRVSPFRIRGLPPVPGVASFLQLEVSTPVVFGDRPGLWLFQLETSKQLVAEALKRTHRLPAYKARMSSSGGDFEATREGRAFRAHYAPEGDPFSAEPGSLAHFLIERYALYTADGGRLYRAELNHPTWSLRRASAEIGATTLAPISLSGEPSLLYAVAGDVAVWPLEEL